MHPGLPAWGLTPELGQTGDLTASMCGGPRARNAPDGPAPFIERAAPGQPHRGKVLATIAPHSDDHSILAGGTITKLIAEGYTGYLTSTCDSAPASPSAESPTAWPTPSSSTTSARIRRSTSTSKSTPCRWLSLI